MIEKYKIKVKVTLTMIAMTRYLYYMFNMQNLCLLAGNEQEQSKEATEVLQQKSLIA